MIRDIKIKAVLNGFIVECGCQTLVAESVEKLLSGIRAYLLNPQKVEKELMTTALNHEHTTTGPIAIAAESGTEIRRAPRLNDEYTEQSPECAGGGTPIVFGEPEQIRR